MWLFVTSIYIEVQSFADNSGHAKMKEALILVSKSSEFIGAIRGLRDFSTSFPHFIF